jgi:hypothetical protein
VSKTMWILLTLLVILALSSMYKEYLNLPIPDHLKCKESMLQQMFSDKCTPRDSIIRKTN